MWFDQSELRGGDAWDQKIRREVRDCALFIPLISANTAARAEGYFRLEWSLAEARSHVRDVALTGIRTDPCLKSLRADRRYTEMLKKLNLS